jgi:hypothetical protein
MIPVQLLKVTLKRKFLKTYTFKFNKSAGMTMGYCERIVGMDYRHAHHQSKENECIGKKPDRVPRYLAIIEQISF